MREIVAALVLGLLTTSSALSKDIAICGASEGYSFFPNVGLGPFATAVPSQQQLSTF